jgi:adenylate cyclase
VDADGVLRRYQADAGGEGGESLGLAALAVGGERPRALPAGTAYLRFAGASPTFPVWNAAEIIASAMAAKAGDTPQVDPARFAGSYVFVGFSAPGLLDRQAVPTDPAMPGAEIHATFVDNALEGRLLARLPGIAALGAALALAIGAGAAAAFLASPAALAGAAGLIGLLPPLAGFALYRSGWVSPTGLWLAAGILTFAAGIILAYEAEGRTRAFLRRSFSQYLAPAVVDELVRNPNALSLGGQERTISVFFSDIQGFTALSESMPPARLASFMNCYLSLLTGEILAEGGTVDKYVGDAIVAFWNAPTDQPDHAARAVRAALRCQAALAASAGRFAALGAAVPVTRIGIHTGDAIVGNMGSPSRFNYTALGDVVNTASRLEEANKATGTAILVSGETVRACGGGLAPDALSFRRLGELAVRNRIAPVEVWEPRYSSEKPGSAEPWEGILDCRRL